MKEFKTVSEAEAASYDERVLAAQRDRAAAEAQARTETPSTQQKAPNVACPLCGAEPGEFCRTGFPFMVHDERLSVPPAVAGG